MRETRELTYDDLVAGHEFPSVQYEITEDQVAKYVEAVEDRHPLYVDEDYARQSKYGHLIAPPTIAALVTTLRVVLGEVGIPPGTIHARQSFKFIRPVKAGDRLTITIRLADKYIERGKKLMVFESLVRNEMDEEVVLARITGIWPR